MIKLVSGFNSRMRIQALEAISEIIVNQQW